MTQVEDAHNPTKAPLYLGVLKKTPFAEIPLDGFDEAIQKHTEGRSCALVVSSDVFVSLTLDYALIELVSKHKMLTEGLAMKWRGIPVFTDAYFHPAQQVLEKETLRLVDFTEDEVRSVELSFGSATIE